MTDRAYTRLREALVLRKQACGAVADSTAGGRGVPGWLAGVAHLAPDGTR